MSVLCNLSRICMVCGITLVLVPFAMAQNQGEHKPETTLVRMTDAAEQNLQKNLLEQPDAWVSSWLAGAPVISAAILNSQTTGGSDELELALTLPLISPNQHQLNVDWRNTEQQLTSLLLNYRRWYASGQVRNLVAQITQHRQQLALVNEQLSTYSEIVDSLQQVASNDSNIYQLYLYQEARVELAAIALEHQHQLALAIDKMQQLTGLSELPSDFVEPSTVMQKPRLNLQRHPQLAMLQAQEQLFNLQYQQASSDRAPWQLTTRVKRVSTAGFDDNQIGLQLDIPLGLGGNQLSQADKTEFSLNQQQWLNDYQQLRSEIQQTYQQSLSDLEALEAKFALLKQSQEARKQAKKVLLSLIRQQEINLDIAQQRLDQIFAQERAISLLELQIIEATANLNQTAGVSL